MVGGTLGASQVVPLLDEILAMCLVHINVFLHAIKRSIVKLIQNMNDVTGYDTHDIYIYTTSEVS